MVFFTCNLCGESVKKPSVEKHYNTRCRGATKNVSCMDCQKDFRGEEYVAHIKCITEAEKYSGKDYVPKEQKNSGAKKQESWMEIVRSILESSEYKLTAAVRNAFQRLQNMDNVPRKQAKFQNFASNCLRVSKPLSVEMWKVLEKELDKMKAANVQPTKTATNKDQPEVNDQSEEATTVAELSVTTEKQKKKKHKHEAAAENGEPTNKVDTKEFEFKIPDTKKLKKQKKQKIVANENDDSPSKGLKRAAEAANGNDVETPAEKKSKKEESTAQDEESDISENTTKLFDWSGTLEKLVAKHVEGILIEKLKKKLMKKYLNKLEATKLSEQQQKKFEKKFLKLLTKSPALQVDGEIVRSC